MIPTRPFTQPMKLITQVYCENMEEAKELSSFLNRAGYSFLGGFNPENAFSSGFPVSTFYEERQLFIGGNAAFKVGENFPTNRMFTFGEFFNSKGGQTVSICPETVNSLIDNPQGDYFWLRRRNLYMNERSWPEDFKSENGDYINKCVYCKLLFKGHKRRVVCRVCAKEVMKDYS